MKIFNDTKIVKNSIFHNFYLKTFSLKSKAQELSSFLPMRGNLRGGVTSIYLKSNFRENLNENNDNEEQEYLTTVCLARKCKLQSTSHKCKPRRSCELRQQG